jgi:hypothetical protein
MSLTVETLEAEALQLPAAERARPVERLVASLDIDPDVGETASDHAKFVCSASSTRWSGTRYAFSRLRTIVADLAIGAAESNLERPTGEVLMGRRTMEG